MKVPEIIAQAQNAVDRGHHKGQQSVSMYEKSVDVIAATRALIDQISQPQSIYRSAQK